MNPDIQKLLEIQEMDQEIRELQAQLNRYPAIWAEVKDGLRAKTEKLDSLKCSEDDRVSERRKVEQELRACTDKMKQYQTQQMLVKTSKELSAINNQIEGLKKSIARLEERALALLNEDGGSSEAIQRIEDELAAAKQKAREERERIRKQVADKKTRIASLEKQRDKMTVNVSKSRLSVYERVRRRWPDDPVVPVRGGSCTGCHFAMLPDHLVKLHKDSDIIKCDNCGRILSHDESFVPSEQEQAV